MTSLIVVGAFLLFTALCVGISLGVGALRARRAARKQPSKKLLIHSINDDRCTGCDACVTVCPTDVLELKENKSRVLRFGDCIQCEQCVTSCPTTALVMHFQGTKAPKIRLPVLDDYYQAAPGLYLIGEAAGKPLVKNASNLGRLAIEHMVSSGLQARGRGEADDVDVLIVGSGPGGLSAALSCLGKGLSYVVVEKDELIASTVARYPKGKYVMAEPYDVKCVGLLPVWDAPKDEIVAAWRTILDRTKLRVQTREAVESIQSGVAGFEVKTTRARYRAQRVVLAIGTRGKPRKLGVPGENLSKVTALLTDPEDHRGEKVLVVGGGDSAVEAALSLAETAARVTLSYRGKQLSRCKAKNRQALEEQVAAGRVQLRFGSNVTEIQEGLVVLKTGADYERLTNDHVFVCIGGDAPVKWLQGVGVRFAEQEHMFSRGPTDQAVEALVGPQKDSTPKAPSAGGGAVPQTVIVDLGSLAGGGASSSRQAAPPSPRRPGFIEAPTMIAEVRPSPAPSSRRREPAFREAPTVIAAASSSGWKRTA